MAVKIAGAGICCLDYLFVCQKVKWGDTCVIEELRTEGGGLVATAMVACARLGAETELFSLLGDDTHANEIRRGLEAENVSTKLISAIRGGKSPVSFIHVDRASGERTIFHRPGSNLHWDKNTDLSAIGQCDALLVDDIYPDLCLQASKTARKHGVRVVADLLPKPGNAELLKHIDILIASQHYLRQFSSGTDDNAVRPALEAIHRAGPSVAIITLGSQGWVCSEGKGIERGPAYSVDVVDTTGCGDVFHGAFATAMAQGKSMRESAQYATATAAMKATQLGGRAGIPDTEQLKKFMDSRR